MKIIDQFEYDDNNYSFVLEDDGFYYMYYNGHRLTRFKSKIAAEHFFDNLRRLK